MKTLDLTQGTQEWLDARLLLRTASEAPAMMGDSKYFTRNQLLDHKRGWTNIINEFRLKLYQEGHEAEARARPIAERILDEDLPRFATSSKTQITCRHMTASPCLVILPGSINSGTKFLLRM